MGKNNANPSNTEQGNTRRCQGQCCAALNCHNSRSKTPHMSFFRFPKDRVRCKKWIENSRRTELNEKDPEVLYRNFVFCADHFEDSQFMNATAKNKLVWNAIPTIFNVSDPPLSIAEEKARGCPLFPPSPDPAIEEDYTSVPVLMLAQMKVAKATPQNGTLSKTQSSTELEQASAIGDECSERLVTSSASDVIKVLPSKGRKRLASVVLTPQQLRRIKSKQLINRQRIKIWRLKKQVQALKNKVKTCDSVDDVVQLASKYMSGVSLNFFANQMRVACKKTHGKRWTREDKFFALILSLTSSEAYRLCSKVFYLPSVRTLQRWVKCFKQEADFEEQLRRYKENLLKNTEGGRGGGGEEDEENPSLLQEVLSSLVMTNTATTTSTTTITTPPTTELMTLESATFNLQTLLPVDNQVGDVISDTIIRDVSGTQSPTSEISTTLDVTLPILDTSTLSTAMDEVVTVASDFNPQHNNATNTNPIVVRGRRRATKKLKTSQNQIQNMELFASLSSETEDDTPQCFQLDTNTLRLLTGSDNIEPGVSTTITAVQEINPEGMVTLTPISDGIPVTLSSDTINLKIVTLDMQDQTLATLAPT